MSYIECSPQLVVQQRCEGNINRQSLQDVIFDYKQPAGPFPDVKSFYDWFAKLSRRMPLAQDETIDPMRAGLQDDDRIVFTHSDLHRSNILVSNLDNNVQIGRAHV